MAKVLTFEIPESEYNDLKSFIKDCSAFGSYEARPKRN